MTVLFCYIFKFIFTNLELEVSMTIYAINNFILLFSKKVSRYCMKYLIFIVCKYCANFTLLNLLANIYSYDTNKTVSFNLVHIEPLILFHDRAR